MLTIALLGAGRIAQVHAANIAANPDTQLAAIADVNAEAAETLANKYASKVMTAEAILADTSIGAVLIASSTDTHADFIEAACQVGKAVLCEKPVDLDLERALACKKATAGSDQPIMIGFNRRFDPNFAALKKAFDDGEIGAGELLSITSFDPAPPPVSYIKVSGGLYRDMMIHDFDIACWIYGSLPAKVTAMGTSIVDSDIGAAGDVDTAVVTLVWADGRIAVIKNSRRAVYGYDQRMELLGSEGLLSAKNVLESTVEKTTAEGTLSAKPEYFFLERYTQAYRAELADFAKCAASGDALTVSLQDGINALTIAEAATLSSTTGKTVLIKGEQIELAK